MKILKRAITRNFNIATLMIVLFFSSIISSAQEVPKVNVTLKLKIIDGDLKNSQITITKMGAPFKVIDPSKGGFAVDLPLGFEYVFTFSKIGYITKTVVVDTHVPENRELRAFAKQISEVELEKQEGGKPNKLSQPVAKISYNMSIGDFDFGKGSVDKVEKTQKNEIKPLAPKPKPNSTTLPKNEVVPPIVWESDYKPESISHQPTGKNKQEKVIQEDYRKITIITINIDGKDYVYKKEEYGWGVYYYKDGKSITEGTFKNETE